MTEIPESPPKPSQWHLNTMQRKDDGRRRSRRKIVGPAARRGMNRLLLLLILLTTRTATPCAADQLPTRAPDVGFEPTTLAVADEMLKLAHVGPDDVVYDLGSGDGRIVVLAAQRYRARGVGIELEPTLVAKARDAAATAGVSDRVTFVEGDLFTTDISPATVVTLYLWPGVNRRLETKLRRELRPGTRIVSNSFGIGNWSPDQRVRAGDGTELMLWTVPRAPARSPDVEFRPTPQTVVDEMLRLASVTPDDVVYDLGSGDGRIPILAATKYGARATGIEIDPRLVEISRQVARDALMSDIVTFVEGDLFEADLSKATIVTLSLSPAVNAKLESKLRRELQPGARIVSHEFPIGDWKPDKTIRASDGTELFLWTVRADRHVRW
jgi:cyclopropane fatty-acyl-phospholipid synthase-like methyltransferase